MTYKTTPSVHNTMSYTYSRFPPPSTKCPLKGNIMVISYGQYNHGYSLKGGIKTLTTFVTRGVSLTTPFFARICI